MPDPVDVTRLRDIGHCDAAAVGRGRARRWAVLGGTLVALAGAAAAGWIRYRQSASYYEEKGRVEYLAGRHHRAAVYLAEAYRLGARGPATRLLLPLAITASTGDTPLAPLGDREEERVNSRDCGALVLIASRDHSARLLDARTGAEVARLPRHESRISFACWSPDGTRVATVEASRERCSHSPAGPARLWDGRTGAELARLDEQGEVSRVSFSPDGTRMVTTGRGSARLWDGRTGAPLARLGSDDRFGAWSPDGAHLVTGNGGEEAARLWDARSGRELLRLAAGGIASASFSPDGTRLLILSWDGVARLWNARTGETLVRLQRESGTFVGAELALDGTRVVTTGYTMPIGMGRPESVAELWDAGTGRALASLRGEPLGTSEASTSPDGTRVAVVGADRTARLWDARTGRELLRLAGQDAVAGVTFSPDGTLLLTHGRRSRLWEARTGRELARLPFHAYFTPDGRRLVGEDNGALATFDVHLEDRDPETVYRIVHAARQAGK